jgi:uncharacterized FlgJ-related protein
MKLKTPKLFIYKPDNLELIRVQKWRIGLLMFYFLFLVGGFFYLLGRYMSLESLSDFEKEVLIVNLKNKNDFSEESFIEMLQELNVKYPYIVLAQARIESGRYSSRIFKENHNLFGMKQANRRINTAEGTQYGHAFYQTWRESVYDYAFYQSRYLSSATTEEEYYYIIGKSYAEDPKYISKLKNEVEKYKLKSKF